MYHFIWRSYPLYIYPSEVCIRGYKEEVGTGYRAPPENYHVHSKHLGPAGVCLCNTYFLFQGQYCEQNQGAAMESPVSPVVANLYMEFFEDRTLITAVNPPDVEKLCGWHICHFETRQERWVPAAHKFCGSSHTVHHRRTETRWFHALPGHFGHPSRGWNINNKSMQEGHPYWSISTMG